MVLEKKTSLTETNSLETFLYSKTYEPSLEVCFKVNQRRLYVYVHKIVNKKKE